MMAVRLRNRMDELGITNQELADKSGIPMATVSRIVAGQTENPNVQTLAALAVALEMSMDEAVGLVVQSDRPVQESPTVAAYQNMFSTLETLHIHDLKRMEEQYKRAIAELKEKHAAHVQSLEDRHEKSITRMENHHKERSAEQTGMVKRLSWERNALIVVIILVLAWALWIDSQLPNAGLIRYAANVVLPVFLF